MDWKKKKILITGGRGFVGSHVVDFLISERNVLRSQLVIPDSKKNDLRIPQSAEKLVKGVDVVLHLAADVGGIGYSSIHPATQMRNCLLVDINMFEAAAQAKVKKFVCVSSAVAYPEKVISPLKEEFLFDGKPALGGYGYGFAKRMAVVLAQAYSQEKGLNTCVLLPANSYGPRQDFSLETGHVIPALIRKCFSQKTLEVWGDGEQIRDFFYVKDFARGVVLAAERLNTPEPVNIGSGETVTIKELVKLIVSLTGFSGRVYFDTTKPEGQKIRTVSIAKAQQLLGFQPKFTLEQGLKETIGWYLNYGKQ